jgi:SpoVK/Ycf46/Vps4 family AAA+-type ATPase
LYAGSRAQSHRNLSDMAVKIDPRYDWNRIILPPDPLSQLREIADRMQHAIRVYDEWGFEGGIANAQGMKVLFAGQSGTGKTMAAEVIANELGLDLFKIDLSAVVSKYIGETEKNLATIFDEAAQSNAILFFDEADALFGKRTEVQDSHDRYANIEVGYLLQRLESYDGIGILATNLRQNIDEAFTRRMDFLVDFPFPEEEYRYRIWQVCFPDDAPLDPAVDFQFLADRYRLSGGNIRNAALAAAFLAAADRSAKINMRHIQGAIRREYQKMGKLLEDDLTLSSQGS